MAKAIMLHHLHNNSILFPKSQGAITADEFSDMIIFCQKKYDILSAKDWLYAFTNGKLKENQVCLTFDDGLKAQYELALPVLKAHNLTAFFFIFTEPLEGKIPELELYRHFRTICYQDIEGFYQDYFGLLVEENLLVNDFKTIVKEFEESNYLINFTFYSYNDRLFRYIRDILSMKQYALLMDKLMAVKNYDKIEHSKHLYMSEEEIKKIALEENLIGLHSHSHFMNLENMNFEEQKKDYYKNYQILSELVGEISACAYPCNCHNEDTFKILEELGIKVAFNSCMHQKKGKYSVPRIDHAYIMQDMKKKV